MKKLEAEGKLDEWIKKTIGWFQKEFGKKNVVSAVLHMDETTPHLHITVVPITDKDAKERKVRPKFDDDGTPIHNYERGMRMETSSLTIKVGPLLRNVRTRNKKWRQDCQQRIYVILVQ